MVQNWLVRIFNNSNIYDEKEYSDMYIYCENPAIYELIDHSKFKKALSVEKKDIDDCLSIDENASTTNTLGAVRLLTLC